MSDNSYGKDAARARLANLFDLSSGEAASLLDSEITEFKCVFKYTAYDSAGGHRDVTYWECLPNPIFGNEVLPGHLFGHLDVQGGYPCLGCDVHALHSNRKWIGWAEQNLISPYGWVIETDVDVNAFPGDWNFSNAAKVLGVDWEEGSSGGAMMAHSPLSYSDHHTAAVGVLSGHYNNAGFYNVHPNIENYANYYASFDSRATQLSSTAPNIEADGDSRTFSYQGLTYAVGGSGGTVRTFSCPSGYWAVGVLGSTSPWDEVGLFGLICAPWNNSGPREFDRFVVLAPGSYDTTFVSTPYYGADYRTYYGAVLSDPGDGGYDRTLAYAICPPDHYMSGITGYEGSTMLEEVLSVTCRHKGLVGGATASIMDDGTYAAHERLGEGTGSWFSSNCTSYNGTNRLVYAMRINSGWATDGVQFYCAVPN